MNTTVHLVGGKRESLPLADLFSGPAQGVRREHVLERGEVITHLSCDPSPTSGFCTIKEKQSFDWPLAMAAATVTADGTTIREATICAGAVAPTPWPLAHVGRALRGIDASNDDLLKRACSAAADGARPMRDNEYKTRLLPVAVRRAVRAAVGLPAIPGQADMEDAS